MFLFLISGYKFFYVSIADNFSANASALFNKITIFKFAIRTIKKYDSTAST